MKKVPATKPQSKYVTMAELSIFTRELLSSVLDKKHFINRDCGYPDQITPQEYKEMFDREGISRRVVQFLPQESWTVDPEVYETEDADETEFEKAWKTLLKDRNVLHYFQRADELSGIGRFGVLLLGLDDGKPLNESVEGVDENGEKTGNAQAELLYLKAFDESAVQIASKEGNIQSPRYGQPTMYSIIVQDSTTQANTNTSTTLTVHWTRVIHVADGRSTSDIYGTPRMQPVYNRLFDLRKILGGSGEMFWRGAFPGMSFEVDANNVGATMDKESIKAQLESYSSGLQRYLALEGIVAKPIPVSAQSPSGYMDEQLKAIAISLGVPARIFAGSEAAQLASAQDALAWAKRISLRQNKYLTPMLIRPFVDRMIAVGVLPEVEEYFVEWPDATSRTQTEEVDIAVKKTGAMAQYISGNVDQLVPPKEYLTVVLGFESEEADAMLEAAKEQEEETAHEHPEMEQSQPGAPVGKAPTSNPKTPVANLTTHGGEGSGNFGHAGRPGEVGGSADGPGFSKAFSRSYEKLKAGDVAKPATMTPKEINGELDKLDAMSKEVVEGLIEEGRGSERYSERVGKTDELSVREHTIDARIDALRQEIELRAGPGMSRLPDHRGAGFGPREKK